MSSEQTPDQSRAASGLDGEGDETTMTRRGVLVASAGGLPGFLVDGHESAIRGFSPTPRPTSLDSRRGRSQITTGEWSQTATLTADDAAPEARFGYSAAIEGDRALVGADTDDENGVDAGAVYIFEHDDRWVQTQKLTADDGAPGDRFGDVVALDEGRALIGARRNDSRGKDAGAAYVFELDGRSWVQTQKLTANDGAPDDNFGRGVALDGPRALIGARRYDEEAKDTGAAYVFELDGGSWVQTQKLTAEDADPKDRFGRAVALDGSRALVGTRLDDGAAPDAGAVYALELEGDRWRQAQKLTAADANESDRFGGAVALGGDRALVGAGRDNEIAEDGGAVYSFVFEEGQWRQTQKLIPDNASSGTRFGSALARQRDTLLVGADHDSEKGTDAGAVFGFQLEENRWRQTQKLTAVNANPKDRFGSAVVLDGNRALVGAINDDAAVDKGGAVYVFTQGGANEEDAESSGGGTLPLTVIALGGVVAVVAAVIVAFGRNLARLAAPLLGRADQEKQPMELLSAEERVLRLLEENGGRMKQQDIQEALDWSQTKTSNVVNDLQDDGKIEVYRIGNENTLALPGEIDI